MMKDDRLIQLLEHYRLREPVTAGDLLYMKQRERAILKTVLQQAGKYSLRIAVTYPVMKLLTKLGMQATFFKATVALAAMITLSVPPIAYGGYKGTMIIIDTITKQVPVSEKSDSSTVPVVEPVKPKIETASKIDQKTEPGYRPHVGVMAFNATSDNRSLARSITRKIVAHLSKKKFKYITKPEDGEGYVNILVTGNVAKVENNYVITVQVTNLDYELIFQETYNVSDKSRLNIICKKIARELTNADL